MRGRASQAGWLVTGNPEDGTVGDAGPVEPVPPAVDGISGVRVARLTMVAVLGTFVSVTALDVILYPAQSQVSSLLVGLPASVAIFVLQLFNSSAAAVRWPAWRRWAMLAALAAATYFPLLVLGEDWMGIAGFLAGSVLLLVRGRAAWALFAAVVASMLVYPLRLGLSAYFLAYLTASTFDTGLVVFGLSRLSLVIRYLHAARGELAQLAIVRERVRFSRDLHDLLGYSLSAITLKAELARRLVSANPGRSRDEIAELLDIARQALADVRTVSSGYRNISLSKEAASVASLLTTAGIDTQVEINCGPLDDQVDTVLATVVRESVTNMLRHSYARACSIEAREEGDVIVLRMLNDGVPRNAATGRRGGGLENLAARLEAIGGRLTATIRDGRFDLLAEAPARPPKVLTLPAPAATDLALGASLCYR
jgi:two-component system, NarL family, sensor histidine kinase DesK